MFNFPRYETNPSQLHCLSWILGDGGMKWNESKWRFLKEKQKKKRENVIGKPTNWLKMVITFLSAANLFIISFFVSPASFRFFPHAIIGAVLKCRKDAFLMNRRSLEESKRGQMGGRKGEKGMYTSAIQNEMLQVSREYWSFVMN